jgi:hypothetical protein
MRCADMCWPRATWYASSRSLRRRLVSGWGEVGNHACWNYFCFTRLDAAADPCLGRKILRRRCADHPLIVTVICRFFRRGLTGQVGIFVSMAIPSNRNAAEWRLRFLGD